MSLSLRAPWRRHKWDRRWLFRDVSNGNEPFLAFEILAESIFPYYRVNMYHILSANTNCSEFSADWGTFEQISSKGKLPHWKAFPTEHMFEKLKCYSSVIKSRKYTYLEGDNIPYEITTSFKAVLSESRDSVILIWLLYFYDEQIKSSSLRDVSFPRIDMRHLTL